MGTLIQLSMVAIGFGLLGAALAMVRPTGAPLVPAMIGLAIGLPSLVAGIVVRVWLSGEPKPWR